MAQAMTGGVSLTKKHRPKVSESSPLLLERVAPKGPGVEGTICDFRTARKFVTPHIRQP